MYVLPVVASLCVRVAASCVGPVGLLCLSDKERPGLAWEVAVAFTPSIVLSGLEMIDLILVVLYVAAVTVAALYEKRYYK